MSLKRLAGVEKSKVSYKRKKATIVYSAGAEPNIDAIKAAVAKLGFTPEAVKVRVAE